MDRAEAIRELTQWRDQMKSHGVPNYGKKLTAIELAIEALQESQTTHDQMDACYIAQKSAVEKLQLSGETSTNEGDAESATTTDCISRSDIEYHTQLEARGNGQYEEVEVAYKSDIDNLPPVTPTERTENPLGLLHPNFRYER